VKVDDNVRARRTTPELKSQTYPLSHAKTYLGRLLEKVHNGEVVYIARGQRRFHLVEVQEIEPIPIRPPGYFANCYSKAEIEDDNRLAKASVIRVPEDVE
jgi:hypothetical protein